MQREVGSLDVSWISWAVADVVTMKMHAAPVSKMSFILFICLAASHCSSPPSCAE